MDVRKPVGRAEQQDLGVGDRLRQRADERDRAPGRDAVAPRCPRPTRRPFGRPSYAGPDVFAANPWPGLRRLDLEGDPERSERLEMRDQRRLSLHRVLRGVEARADLRPRVRDDGVQRVRRPERTSIPVTVSAGPDQMRSPRPPVPRNGRPGLDLREVAELVVAVRARRSTPPGEDRRTATSPLSSCNVASARISARSASGAAPPNWPLCFGPASVVAATRDGRHPAQADRQRRRPGTDAAHVTDDHRVGLEELGLRRRVQRERAADLLLALDHDLDPDRGLATEGAERTDVHQDVRLGSRRSRARRSRRRGSTASNGGDSHFDSSPAPTTS